ncbi:MAG: hypothetical protein QM681_18435 [Novosphingobium sp.]
MRERAMSPGHAGSCDLFPACAAFMAMAFGHPLTVPAFVPCTGANLTSIDN